MLTKENQAICRSRIGKEKELQLEIESMIDEFEKGESLKWRARAMMIKADMNVKWKKMLIPTSRLNI